MIRTIPNSSARTPSKPRQWVRSGVMNFDDFCAMVQDGRKGDLIDGVIYMASPDNTDNAELQVWLLRLLAEFVDLYRLGTVYGSRVAYKMDEKNSPEPDISFIAQTERSRIKRGRVNGPPTLAIEVVSPDSAQRDYEIKYALYEQAGVQEYWIIDPDEKRATFYYRKGARLVEGRLLKHQWHSKVLPGFTLDVRDQWAEERPRVFDLLRSHYYPEKPHA